MKIVLDTNVIVSALLCPQSLPAKILGLVLNGTVGIVYDNQQPRGRATRLLFSKGICIRV
jgi:predicted nucleic acid-binding protein